MSTNAMTKKPTTTQFQKISKMPKAKAPLSKKSSNNLNKENCNPNSKNTKHSSKNVLSLTLADQPKTTRNSFARTPDHSASKLSSKSSSSKRKVSPSKNLENLIQNITLKNKFSKKDYHYLNNQILNEDYGNDILSSLLSEESTNENFLSKHQITERMRSRMVDWMIEVLTNYSCCDEAYFMAVSLMDKYFQKCEEELQPNDLHLIGVTCMFIASKYQDIYPLRLRILYEKISHRKLTCEEIKDREEKITKCLNYDVTFPTMWDFTTLIINEIFIEKFNHFVMTEENKIVNEIKSNEECDALLAKLYNEKMVSLLKLVCLYLAKMNCHDYNLIGKKPSLLAASSIFVGVKICEQINKQDYITEYFVNRLSELSTYSEDEIIRCAQKILKNAQEFDTLFPNLDNLKRVHFKPILDFKMQN